MTFFNLPLKQEKSVPFHPWHKTIKDEYFHKMKYAHNSIENPEYPQTNNQKSEKIPITEKIKFTVIGNRVTEEFIYCMKLVEGLYTCRPKYFEPPVIKGVTTPQWPSVWHELKMEHGCLAYYLQSHVAILVNGKILGGKKELKDLVESKFVYHLSINYYKESVAQFASYVKSSGRPCAYMHISIDKVHIGTLIFMLYADVLPITCENFLRLCRSKKGGYSGTPVHRIVKDGWIQCGGFHLKDTDMSCENFIVPFDKRGVLAMANAESDVDCSTQFFVLLQPAPWMEHKYVAFGQLIDGAETLRKIEEVPTWYEDPLQCIEIHTAGILNLECQGIVINKGANEYIQGHIEDLYKLGEMLFEALLDKVFLEIESKRIASFTGELGEIVERKSLGNIRAVKSFKQKMGDIKALHSELYSNIQNEDANEEFDVESYEDYEYEQELAPYQHVSLSSSVAPPEQLFYIPLTDVSYPDEVDSSYDLKKFLRGDYCLESDLKMNSLKRHPTNVFDLEQQMYSPSSSESTSVSTLESEQEMDIKWYISNNADKVSFAGDIIKGIARSMAYFRDRPNNLLSDDELRRLKTLYKERKRTRKISIQPRYSRDLRKLDKKLAGILNQVLETNQKSMQDIETLDQEDIEDKSRPVESMVQYRKKSLLPTRSSPYKGSPEALDHQPLSLGAIEFARRRPTITVFDYKLRNHPHHIGIRLPGDTPLYSSQGSSGNSINQSNHKIDTKK